VPQVEYQNDSDEACRTELQATKETRFQLGDMAKSCYRGIPVTWGGLTLFACPISAFNGAYIVMILWAVLMVSASRSGVPGGIRTRVSSGSVGSTEAGIGDSA
jgi:hypothetical protein